MTQILWLDPDDIDFPPTEEALDEPNGLLAAGGDLSRPRLLNAYRQGIFPWYEDGQPILWRSPSPRSILLPEQLHISRSLRKTLRQARFEVTADQAFADVIEACSEAREYSSDTWITEEMKAAYIDLHRAGHAHSIEAWYQGELVGGLYGIAMGKVFFGESMFSRRTDASKVAFVHLVGQLQTWGYQLIDCQVSNSHLQSLGSTEIDRHSFQDYLARYIPADSEQKIEINDATGSGTWDLQWRYTQT